LGRDVSVTTSDDADVMLTRTPFVKRGREEERGRGRERERER
jgi:hypothetical protein